MPARQRAADVERRGSCLAQHLHRQQPAPQAQRVLPEARALDRVPVLVVARRGLQQARRTSTQARTRARARRRGPPSGSGRTPTPRAGWRPRRTPPTCGRRAAAARASRGRRDRSAPRARRAHPRATAPAPAPPSPARARRSPARSSPPSTTTRRRAHSASSRTHAPSRWRGLTFEYVIVVSSVAAHAGHRAGEPAPRHVDLDVHRPGLARRSAPAPGSAISSTPCQIDCTTGNPSWPGGSLPAAISARIAVRPSVPAITASSSRWPTPHFSSASSSTGSASLDLVGVVADADPEPLAQERAHGMLDEAHEVRRARADRARAAAAARAGTRARLARACPSATRAPSSVTRSKLHGCLRPGRRGRSCAGRTAAAGAGRARRARPRPAARPPAPPAGARRSCARRCPCR